MTISRRCVITALAALSAHAVQPIRLAGLGAGFGTLSGAAGPVLADGVDRDAAALAAALARGRAGDWRGAFAAVRDAGPIAVDLLRWHWLREEKGELADYEGFVARRPDWPGMALLRSRAEPAVARAQAAGAAPQRVLAWFAPSPPRTAAGALALVRAFNDVGQADNARSAALAAWRSLAFRAEEKSAFLAIAGSALDRQHEGRLDHLLWEDRGSEAERMRPLVSEGWRRLAAARLALRAGQGGVDGLVAAVPQALASDPGLAHARFDWRMAKGRREQAAALMLERSGSAADLGRPEAWARGRASLVREMLQDGRAPQAYRLAASHRLTEGSAFADLEFLAGFIALRQMREAGLARPHFQRLAEGVATPISLARAHYWLGRTAEAEGAAADAQAAYRRAAVHQTAYYGLLAAERLGLRLDTHLARAPAEGADWRDASFLRSDVMRAALLAQRAGDRALARRFMLHHAEGMGLNDLQRLGAMALQAGDDNLAVLLGKQAATRQIILPAAYYPVSKMVPGGVGLSRPLALAIARRESEFDPAALSPAGARGLMQLMPGTARLMARKLGLPYDQGRLTSDPSYNVRLGSAYVLELIEGFGPSLALVAAGYNAGPGRPRGWMQTLGDPRRADVDIVDWVEMVPFAETRTYIMRVAEGRVIYGDRLAGQPSRVAITAMLKGTA